MEEMVFIKTPDLELAATLNYIGFDVLGITKHPKSKQAIFLFENSEKVSTAIYHIRNKKASQYYKFEPMDLLYTRKTLLQRLKESSYGT